MNAFEIPFLIRVYMYLYISLLINLCVPEIILNTMQDLLCLIYWALKCIVKEVTKDQSKTKPKQLNPSKRF